MNLQNKHALKLFSQKTIVFLFLFLISLLIPAQLFSQKQEQIQIDEATGFKAEPRPTIIKAQDYFKPAPGSISLPQKKSSKKDYNSVANVNTMFSGPVFEDNAEQLSYYASGPNPMGAVGVGQVLSVVNALIESRAKDGTFQWQEDLYTFFADLTEPAEGSYIYDPKIVYDPHENRFVTIALETNELQESSRLLMAVSKDDSPASATSADWFYSAIDTIKMSNDANAWLISAALGFDEEAIYVTAFLGGFPWDIDYSLWIINKDVDSGLYNGGPISYSTHYPMQLEGATHLIGNFTPLKVYGEAGITGGDGNIGNYILSYGGLFKGNDNYIQAIRVDDPLGKENGPLFTVEQISIGSVDVPYSSLPSAPQPGAVNTFLENVDTGSRDIFDCLWRDGSLWAVTAVTPTSGVDKDQTTVHWLKFATDGLSESGLTLTDQGNIGGEDLSPGTFTYYPSIAVNGNGDVQFNFSASSPTMYVGTYTSGRSADDPAGGTRPAEAVAPGLDFYMRLAGISNAWGPQSSIAADPENDNNFWLFNAYAGDRTDTTGFDDGRWETVWANVSYAQLSENPQIIAGPDAYDFTHVFVGDSSMFKISIENLGGVDLVINDITLPGEPFSIDAALLPSEGQLPVSIPALTKTELVYKFKPLTAGTFIDSVQIHSNDSVNPVKTLLMQGRSTDYHPAKRGLSYALPTDLNTRYSIAFDLMTGKVETATPLSSTDAPFLAAINSKGEVYTPGFPGLRKFDPYTGETSTIFETGFQGLVQLAFSPDDILYIVERDFNTLLDIIYTLNTETGEVTELGWPGKALEHISFNPIDGSLWAGGGDSRTVGEGRDVWDFVYKIDLETGLATELGQIGIEPTGPYWTSFYGFGFDPFGNLFGTIRVDNDYFPLFLIDQTTIEPTILYNLELIPGMNSNQGFWSIKSTSEGANLFTVSNDVDFGKSVVKWVQGDLQEIKIYNLGTDDLTISDISEPDGPFGLLTDSLSGSLPITIPSYGYEKFHVTFAAPDTGIFTASIMLASNDSNNPSTTINLSGKGALVELNEAFGIVGEITDISAGTLVSINPASGAATALGSSQLDSVSSLAVTSSGYLYAAESDSGVIYRINHLNGQSEPVVLTDLPGFSALAFDSQDSLFAISTEGPAYPLYRIDIENGSAEKVGDTWNAFTCLAFDPTDGLLWAVNADSANGVYTLNPKNAATDFVGPTGISSGKVSGIMFDQVGNLFGVYRTILTSRYISIDKVTGKSTTKGSMGFKGINDLTSCLKRSSFVVSIENLVQNPVKYALSENYPNPFNPTTTINYALKENTFVKLQVYNLLGQVVKTLVNENQAGGYKTTNWDGTNQSGIKVPSGVYIYRIEADKFVQSRKMILIK